MYECKSITKVRIIFERNFLNKKKLLISFVQVDGKKPPEFVGFSGEISERLVTCL